VTAPSSTEDWDDFFGDFYLRAYVHDQADAQAGEDALAAAKLAGVEPGADVVDVPCGYGRHTIALARAGYRVVGVDRSQTLLDEAGRRAGHERWPKLVRADYRELPLPEESFDAALNLFTSLGYLGDEEDTKVLAAIRRVLRPGGRLVLETMHRDRLVTQWRDNDWMLMGEGRLLLAQRTWDPVTGVAQTTQTLVDAQGARDSRTFSVRTYSATELLRMLEEAGYSDAKVYGSFRAEPLTTTSRLVIVATKDGRLEVG
jgi:ubiquinone/menaquinone biosynthesis C-methylase UbiE